MRALPALLGVSVIAVNVMAVEARRGVLPSPQSAGVPCDVSQSVTDRPPDDPSASSFASPSGTWFANANRTLWAWWWGRRSVGDYKVLWVRPRGRPITIVGHRLDGPAPPLAMELLSTDRATFRTSALAFPAPGCWRLTATAGGEALAFTVAIP